MKRIICVLLIMLLCVGLATCNNNSSSTNNSVKQDGGQNNDSGKNDQSVYSNSSNETYATVKEYLDTPEVQSQINSTIEENKTDDLEMSVYAEGDDTLVYDYTYTKTYDENGVAELKSGLDTALEEKSSTFTSIAGTLKTYVDVENPKVKVIYRNGDHTIITEKTFES